jgi:hypothetical protein
MSAPGHLPALDKNPASTSHSPFLLTPNQSQPTHLSPVDDSQSGSRKKPKMPRSESFNPSPPHRPDFSRSAHSSFNISGMSSNMFPTEENGDELTTKGRKRKRLAKACSACHVSLFRSNMADVRKTSDDVTVSTHVPTASSHRKSACT